MTKLQRGWSLWSIIALVLVVGAATAAVTALLMNIAERKSEAKTPFVRLVEVDEDTTDPARWGVNTNCKPPIMSASSSNTDFCSAIRAAYQSKAGWSGRFRYS